MAAHHSYDCISDRQAFNYFKHRFNCRWLGYGLDSSKDYVTFNNKEYVYAGSMNFLVTQFQFQTTFEIQR